MKRMAVLLFIVVLTGCSEQKEEAKASVQQEQESSKTLTQKTTESVQKLAQSVEEDSKEVAQKVKEVADDTPEASEQVTETLAEAPVLRKSDGQVLFNKCISCHGTKAEKSALGKSQVIAGWSEEKIVASLKGYQDGSYGGAMKGLMKGQVKSLSDEEIAALAAYISKQ